MSDKLKVGILGGTGMVGQRFISLLENHPWFEVTTIAASPRSAGKTYEEAVGGRWKMQKPMPEAVKNIVVKNVNDIEAVSSEVDFVFSAVDMTKEEIKKIEEDYAKTETPVVSNNSAHRWTPDVPMIVPEVNPEHLEVIESQKKRLGTKRGFICVKPNCSIQSYAPALTAWRKFEPTLVVATTYQAISGAGKTFKDWPEMEHNIIPYIGGEEEKSEQEPLRIWGKVENGQIVKADGIIIQAPLFPVYSQKVCQSLGGVVVSAVAGVDYGYLRHLGRGIGRPLLGVTHCDYIGIAADGPHRVPHSFSLGRRAGAGLGKAKNAAAQGQHRRFKAEPCTGGGLKKQRGQLPALTGMAVFCRVFNNVFGSCYKPAYFFRGEIRNIYKIPHGLLLYRKFIESCLAVGRRRRPDNSPSRIKAVPQGCALFHR